MIHSGADTTIIDSASASNTTDTAFDSTSNTSGYYSGLHEWTCGNMTFPLIIDGSSVKFFMKVFSPREIAQLKSLNGKSEISTYQFFESVDSDTKNCKFEYDSFETDDPLGYSYTYTGMAIGGVPKGAGFYEDDHWIKYVTFD